MTDIIWGNGTKIISKDSFVLNVTHKKNGNKNRYSESEKIIISDADLPGLPHVREEWDEESLKSCVIDAFLKCEIEKIEEGRLVAKVSHSGAGGY